MTPEMHSEADGSHAVACPTCGHPFAPKRRWSRFCCVACRNAYHQAQRRIQAIEKAGLQLYRTLASLAAVEGPVGQQATLAIAGLKPPATPRELLEKARA